jgi:hypothetical protein
MSISALQKAAAQAIVNIFETGSVRGDYAEVTLIPGDSGELTYGRTQTTLASGNLFLLIKAYADRGDGAYGDELRAFLPRLEAHDPGLNHDRAFRTGCDDPVCSVTLRFGSAQNAEVPVTWLLSRPARGAMDEAVEQMMHADVRGGIPAKAIAPESTDQPRSNEVLGSYSRILCLLAARRGGVECAGSH